MPKIMIARKDRRLPDDLDDSVAEEMKGGGMSKVPAKPKPRPADAPVTEDDESGQQMFTRKKAGKDNRKGLIDLLQKRAEEEKAGR